MAIVLPASAPDWPTSRAMGPPFGGVGNIPAYSVLAGGRAGRGGSGGGYNGTFSTAVSRDQSGGGCGNWGSPLPGGRGSEGRGAAASRIGRRRFRNTIHTTHNKPATPPGTAPAHQ